MTNYNIFRHSDDEKIKKSLATHQGGSHNSMVKGFLLGLILLLLVMIGLKFWDFSDSESRKFEEPIGMDDKISQNPKPVVDKSMDAEPRTELEPDYGSLEEALELSMLSNSPILKDLTLGFSSVQAMRKICQFCKKLMGLN